MDNKWQGSYYLNRKGTLQSGSISVLFPKINPKRTIVASAAISRLVVEDHPWHTSSAGVIGFIYQNGSEENFASPIGSIIRMYAGIIGVRFLLSAYECDFSAVLTVEEWT